MRSPSSAMSRDAIVELTQSRNARDDRRQTPRRFGRRDELARLGVRMHGRRLEEVGGRRSGIPRLVKRGPQKLERSARRTAVDLRPSAARS